jgi:hypothetical protein
MMVTIEIREDNLVKALKEVARQQNKTVDEVATDALTRYLQGEQPIAHPYSFIGIGHSGKGNISTAVDETLAEAANRHEGWRS